MIVAHCVKIFWNAFGFETSHARIFLWLTFVKKHLLNPVPSRIQNSKSMNGKPIYSFAVAAYTKAKPF